MFFIAINRFPNAARLALLCKISSTTSVTDFTRAVMSDEWGMDNW
jgi:hypothetical protein